jgi:hypothetical protein
VRAPPEPEGGPVVVRVANCQSVSAGARKSATIFRTALTKSGPFGVPDVVLGCECSDFDAEKIAEAEGWQAAQFGHPTDTARRGSVAAFRTDGLVTSSLAVGSEAGEGIRTRYVVSAFTEVNGHAETFIAGHAPPDRAPNAQAEWLAKVDEWPGILGADFNTHGPTLDRMFARQVRAIGVLALLVPADIPCSTARAVDIGSDHPAVDVLLWPTMKEIDHA